MGRSHMFSQMARMMRIARFCNDRELTTKKGLDLVQKLEEKAWNQRMHRRDFIRTLGIAAAGTVGATTAGLHLHSMRTASAASAPRVAIVGAGLGGLVCADRLETKGIIPTIYEGHPHRVGGRIWSDRSTFPGQVAEYGGELIDNLHKTLLGYATRFKLTREDLNKNPGEVFYHFFGRHYSEREVIEEFRVLEARMRPDFQKLSSQPTFFSHTADDVALDYTDLETYLATRAADLPLIRSVLNTCYVIEYGREFWELSCLDLLFYIHLDRRAKFCEFGIFSDERFHITEGVDAITNGIRDSLQAKVINGAFLKRLSRNKAGEFELEFEGKASSAYADVVVLAIPPSVMRDVDLDESLGLSADKMRAITDVQYGYNAKTMVGFDARPWIEAGSNGMSYTDLPNVQNTWETNYTRAGKHAIITDYSGGNRAYNLQVPRGGSCSVCHNSKDPSDVKDDLIQQQVDDFLTDLDRVYPGAKAAASRVNGKYVVSRGHWLPQKYCKGSYIAYAPGQFTTICGLEGQSAGALKFAGDFADSFYVWQGFMEGAALSGVATANEIVDDIHFGRI